MSQDLLDILVCPACRAKLAQTENEWLRCLGCGLIYPVEDGIPVLLAGRARRPDSLPSSGDAGSSA
ncbi:MAG: Trm112 family protein [Acidobacteriaceae bacterium]